MGGSSHILSTLPVVWLVLLHKTARCQSFLSTTVRFKKDMFQKVKDVNFDFDEFVHFYAMKIQQSPD